MHLENTSSAQELDEVIGFGPVSVSDSFENYLLQVEPFYPSLRILREQVWLDQIVKDEKVIPLKD